EQLAVVARLDQGHVDLRPVRAEAAQERGDDARADALVRPDAERAGVTGPERAQVRLRGAEPRGDRARVRERDRARATGTIHEPLADDPFEDGDLLADRRLRVAEPPRVPSERALF